MFWGHIQTGILAIFQELANPFEAYSTEHRRLVKFGSAGLVQPKAFPIGTRLETNAAISMNVACDVQYIPLHQTLRLLFSKSEFVKANACNTTR